MAWNAALVSRASTKVGAPHSMAAMVTVSDLENLSLSVVVSRAIVLADVILWRLKPTSGLMIEVVPLPETAG